MPKQHTTPCKECPWRRVSMRGWLANEPITEWLGRAHGEVVVPCHMHLKGQCAGMAIYRGNVGKKPRYAEVLALPPNPALVFATPMEFTAHHTLDRFKVKTAPPL